MTHNPRAWAAVLKSDTWSSFTVSMRLAAWGTDRGAVIEGGQGRGGERPPAEMDWAGALQKDGAGAVQRG